MAMSVNSLNTNSSSFDGNVLLETLKLLGCKCSCTEIHNTLLDCLQMTKGINSLKFSSSI
jgi:hypothetical protein